MWLEVSDDGLAEQAYLVTRQVRALALAGHCAGDPETISRLRQRLGALAKDGAVPFVIVRWDGIADYGFAARDWAVGLYRWLVTAPPDTVPPIQRHRIVGLLLGYGSDSISQFEDGYQVTAASPGSTAR